MRLFVSSIVILERCWSCSLSGASSEGLNLSRFTNTSVITIFDSVITIRRFRLNPLHIFKHCISVKSSTPQIPVYPFFVIRSTLERHHVFTILFVEWQSIRLIVGDVFESVVVILEMPLSACRRQDAELLCRIDQVALLAV